MLIHGTQAWEKCGVKDWNLGEACLVDRKTKAAYREYLRSDEMLRKEIEGKIGDVHQLDTTLLEADQEQEEAEDDNTDIPLESIIQQEMALDNISLAQQQFCVMFNEVSENQGQLQPSGKLENIWAYTDDGDTWGHTLPTE
jgi:hypothetical protein